MSWVELAALVTVVCYTRYAGQQADAAIKAANAAKNAAAIARQTLETEERAYVGVASLDLHADADYLETGKAPTARVGFFNVGRTPATEVVGEVVLSIGPSPCSSKNNFEYREDLLPPPGRTIIYPSIIYYMESPQGPLPPSYGVGLRERRFKSCVYGRVSYDDTLGNHHMTHFCFFYVFTKLTPNIEGSANSCPYYNTME
jgi:hypothetical protein